MYFSIRILSNTHQKGKSRCKILSIELKDTSWGRGTSLWKELGKAIIETDDKALKMFRLSHKIFLAYSLIAFTLAAIGLFTLDNPKIFSFIDTILGQW